MSAAEICYHRMQVRDGAVVVYPEPLDNTTPEKRDHMRDIQKKQYSGTVTSGVKKRMQRAISLMSQATKPKWMHNPVNGKMQLHRFSFITLTIANNTRMLTPREGYPLLLKPFLRWLRESKKVKLYLWRAEPQQRGQLHYHIICPEFIHHAEIRQKWNHIQKEAGLLTAFAKDHGHYQPPSTEIRETRHVKKMANYIGKELLKRSNGLKRKAKLEADQLIADGILSEDEKGEFIEQYTGEEMAMDGKIWGCSDSLTGTEYFSTPCRQWHFWLLNNMVQTGAARMVSGDYWMVVYFEDGDPPDLLNEIEKASLDDHIKSILN